MTDKEREEWAARRCECSADDFCAIAKERDKLAILAELSDGYRRERDEARAQLAAALKDQP